MRKLRTWTPKQALAVVGLLRVWIVWYILSDTDMEEGHRWQYLQQRSIYGYLLILSTWGSSLNFIPVYYQLVLHQSQRGYFSFEVQSCTFITQFNIMDISVTFLCLVILITFVEASRRWGTEQDHTLESEGSPRISPIAWWFGEYLC